LFKRDVKYDGEMVRNAVHLAFLRPDQIWLHLGSQELVADYEQTMFDLTNGKSKGTNAIAEEVDEEGLK
jgi:regulatory protein YycI of two-component signal transduction system YycFG